jgi:hypothetical protein
MKHSLTATVTNRALFPLAVSCTCGYLTGADTWGQAHDRADAHRDAAETRESTAIRADLYRLRRLGARV